MSQTIYEKKNALGHRLIRHLLDEYCMKCRYGNIEMKTDHPIIRDTDKLKNPCTVSDADFILDYRNRFMDNPNTEYWLSIMMKD